MKWGWSQIPAHFGKCYYLHLLSNSNQEPFSPFLTSLPFSLPPSPYHPMTFPPRPTIDIFFIAIFQSIFYLATRRIMYVNCVSLSWPRLSDAPKINLKLLTVIRRKNPVDLALCNVLYFQCFPVHWLSPVFRIGQFLSCLVVLYLYPFFFPSSVFNLVNFLHCYSQPAGSSWKKPPLIPTGASSQLLN